ncbi:MAG TPA: hypothetical protein VFY16_13725 [Gemmatimonadaceae bacterium]|nr:hypothetical protein [Gemmatimonadaceae bacterium]
MQEERLGFAGTPERITTRQRTAVQREVTRLLDELAPERPPARRDAPAPEVKLHRAPGRCILQAAATAVSVSWFPARRDEDTLGEMLVISWRGVVSVPGAARSTQAEPVPLDTLLLHPVESDDGAWQWRPEDGRPVLETSALACYCRGLLQH